MLNFFINILFVYSLLGLVFYLFMTKEEFWKTNDLIQKVFYSIFWPISIVIIYILIRRKGGE